MNFVKNLFGQLVVQLGIFYIIAFYCSWYFIIITISCIIHCVTYYNYYKYFMMNNKTNYSSYLNYIKTNRNNIYIDYKDYLLNEHIWNFNDEKQDELNNYIEYK